MIAGWVDALRSSMTAQIGLSITLVSALLVAGSGYLLVRMTADELREGGDVIMLANSRSCATTSKWRASIWTTSRASSSTASKCSSAACTSRCSTIGAA